MESMIAYRFGTLPHQSIHMSSGYNAAITAKPSCFSRFSTKPHLSFSHNSSFSLPMSSRGRPLEHILGPITFTVGHPSTNLTDQTSRPPHVQPEEKAHFFTAQHVDKVLTVAKELKDSKHDDIADKLMKLHEPPQVDAPGKSPEDLCKQKMDILQLLIAKDEFKLADKYCADIDQKKSSYDRKYFEPQFFDNLKFVVKCGLENHGEADNVRLASESAASGQKTPQ